MSKKCSDCKFFDESKSYCFLTDDPVDIPATSNACPDFEQRTQTLFHQITASPEVLAPKFVYYTVNRGQFGTYYWYCSALIPGEKWSEESEAIAETLVRLKEVGK